MDAEAGERRVRWGLFGGSFDPVHRGHLYAARVAREHFGLADVLFVPARRSPHKLDRMLADGRDRLAMLAIALRELGFGRIAGVELERPGPSYTIDTVRDLPTLLQAPEDLGVYLILGADNLGALDTWRGVEELLQLVQPVVVARGERMRALLAELAGRLSPAALERLEAGLVDVAPVDISSTGVRRALAAGRDPGDDLPAGVMEYVRARGIYGFERPASEP